MTAPAPSPAEQAVIDRFEAAEPLPESMEGWAERVLLACGLPEGQLHAGGPITPVAYLVAAVAAYRAAQDGGAEEADDLVRTCPGCGAECERGEGVCLCDDDCPIPPIASNR